jgi:hypothetical protein
MTAGLVAAGIAVFMFALTFFIAIFYVGAQ